MIELPEAMTLARQLNKEIKHQTIKKVYLPTHKHKFAFFHNSVENYPSLMENRKIKEVHAFGIFIEICFDDGLRFNFNDGVNVRILKEGEQRPTKYQLLIELENGSAIFFTIAMYGALNCYNGEMNNRYYNISKNSVSVLRDEFDYPYFLELFNGLKPTMSLKAFLATEQRIPGVGNGVIQDILFDCKMNPKNKLSSLNDDDKTRLFSSLKSIIQEMTLSGGRNTEKDLYGKRGNYLLKLSKDTYKNPCPRCNGIIEKKSFLGGSVYYCLTCQPLNL